MLRSLKTFVIGAGAAAALAVLAAGCGGGGQAVIRGGGVASAAEAPRVLQRLTWENQAGKVISIYENLLRS